MTQILKVNVAAILLASTAMVGCTEDSITIGEVIPSEVSEAQEPNDTNPLPSRYNGNYLTACTPNEDEEGVWQVGEISIQDNIAPGALTQYSDSECTQPTIMAEFTFALEYPGGIRVTPLGDADFVNITVDIFTVNGVDATESAPDENFDLILLNGNNLFFGLNTEELDGDSEETRPVELDIETPFSRI